MWVDVLFEDFVCKCAHMWESVYGPSGLDIHVPILGFSHKLYCCIICFRNSDKGILMYLYWYNILLKHIVLMSMYMCLELTVLMLLFYNNFEVLRSAVLVVSSPG